MRGRGMTGDRAARWWQVAGVAVLGLAAAALTYLALTSHQSPPEPNRAVETGLGQSPSSATDQGTQASEPSAEPTVPSPPEVPDQRKVDFTKGDGLPDGARLYDGGGNQTGMALAAGGLTHGPPTGLGAVGYLEARLDSEVQKLGMRVRFDATSPGLIALVAWRTSVGAALDQPDGLPRTGMRLLASAGAWRLEASGDPGVIAQGEFDPEEGANRFEIVRRGDEVWVRDPTGAVAHAVDPRIAELAGPWACWELTETATDQVPVVIESVWAG